jgi:3-isopropylmalate/(R)-2-methylmalate dehydratase small subunit
MNQLEGVVHKYYRDNIDTDVIIPGQYLKIHDHKELAKHAMEGVDPEFSKKVNEGDFLLCGRNFGCGSSREHAPIALANCGIKAIIDGDRIILDTISSKLVNITNNRSVYDTKPFSKIIARIIEAGGLFNLDPQQLIDI